MRVQTQHFAFVVEKDSDETHEQHRSRAFAVAVLLDAHPEYATELDAVVIESKAYVARRAARCLEKVTWRFFGNGEVTTPVAAASVEALPALPARPRCAGRR
jgi:hypothetical protein